MTDRWRPVPDDSIAPAADEPERGLGRVLANLSHLIGGKALGGVMSLVYLVLVARTLGARDYGVLVLVNGYATFVGALVAFSGFHGVVRYGAIALETGDRARLARIVRFMTLVEIACGLVAVAVAAGLARIVGPRLGWTPEAMRIALPFSLAVFGTVRATPQGILQIAGRFDLIGLHQIVSPTVRLIGSLIAWQRGGGLDAFLLVWLVSSLCEGGAMWALAWRPWRGLTDGARLWGPWRGVARTGGFGRFVLLTNADLTLRELAPNLAPLTIGWLLGPAAAGLYALAQRATAALQQPATLLTQASYSVFAGQAARGRTDLLSATVRRSTLLALGVAVPFVAVILLASGGLLSLIGGRSFRGGGALVALVAVARGLALAGAPLAAGLTALGLPQRSMTATLIANLALYPLLPVFLLWGGVTGAGWHAMLQAAVLAGLLLHGFERATRRQGGARNG